MRIFGDIYFVQLLELLFLIMEVDNLILSLLPLVSLFFLKFMPKKCLRSVASYH